MQLEQYDPDLQKYQLLIQFFHPIQLLQNYRDWVLMHKNCFQQRSCYTNCLQVYNHPVQNEPQDVLLTMHPNLRP